MFGKCFFVFVFKNLLLRIKLKNNFLCFFIKKKNRLVTWKNKTVFQQ